MSQTFHRPATGDTRTVPDVLAGNYTETRGWLPGPMPGRTADDGGNELKGDALNEALEKAGLPKTGSADEKRARLAEHEENN